MQRARSLSMLALALAAAACSSDGDGGPSVQNQIAGTLQVLPTDSTILEAEPNDSADTAHVLGSLDPGGSITVIGNITDDGSDAFDGFMLKSDQRVTVTASITAQDPTADIDLFVVDPVSLQFVERFETPAANETGTFTTKGSYFVLVFSAGGTSDYTLDFSAVAAPASVAEVESNDTAPTGQYLGEMAGGDSISISGEIGSSDEDFYLVTFPSAGTLNLSLSGGAQDFDMQVLDGTSDLSSPTIVSTFDTNNEPETGSSGLSAMSLAVVRVYPFMTASGPYTLDLSSTVPLTVAGSVAQLSRAPRASADVEARVFTKRSADASFTTPAHDQMPGDVVLRWDDQPQAAGAIHLETLDQSLAQFGGRVVAAVPGGARKASFDLPAGLSEQQAQRYTTALAASLRGAQGVRYAEPDFVLRPTALPRDTEPNDGFYNLQWHYPQIQLPAAWDLTTGDNNVIIAVLDTGSTPHPDLVGREIAGKDMISNTSISGDGDGVDNDPFDVGDSQGPQPSSYHGSHVAGTIGAETNNGSGVAGVTWAGRMMHVRVLGIGGGSGFDILNGILWAAGRPNSSGTVPPEAADIINMSLGGGGFSQATQDACTEARNQGGAVVIAAAGNENSSTPSYPAAYANVVSVAAVDFQANRAPYSNFHPTVDIAAPGGDVSADRNGDGYADGVLSTKPDDSSSPINFDSYSFYQGTSMAAPHVAGVVALMKSVNPALTPGEAETILSNTATDIGPAGRDNQYGEGLVNAFAAVQATGGGGSGAPVLALASDTVLFDTPGTARTVAVANVGGMTLNVSAPTVSTNNGGNWLSASRNTIQTPTTTDTASIQINVTGGNLPVGLYTGEVMLASNGGSASIGVSLSIGGGGSILDKQVFVLAVNADTDPLVTVAQRVVQTGSGLGYDFTDLPAGNYFVVAGTDENNDGFICDPGEPLCGIYPSLEGPSVLTVVEGQNLTGINFPLGAGAFGASTSERPVFQLLTSPEGSSSEEEGDDGQDSPADHQTQEAQQ